MDKILNVWACSLSSTELIIEGYHEEKNRQLLIILAIIISVFSASALILIAYMVIFPSRIEEESSDRQKPFQDDHSKAGVIFLIMLDSSYCLNINLPLYLNISLAYSILTSVWSYISTFLNIHLPFGPVHLKIILVLYPNISLALYLNVSLVLYLNISLVPYNYISLALYLNISLVLFLNISLVLYLKIRLVLHLNISLVLYLNISLPYILTSFWFYILTSVCPISQYQVGPIS